MKKKILSMILLVTFLVGVIPACYAAEDAEMLEETNKDTITSWGLLQDTGFFVESDKESPYYGWLYAPDGKLLIEGYVDMYTYYAGRGYVSIYFRTSSGRKQYYAHPSNIIMESRS